MGKHTYRLGVAVTVSKGEYGYGTIVSREFDITAPLDILQKIDISSSAYNLFHDALDELEEMREGEE